MYRRPLAGRKEMAFQMFELESGRRDAGGTKRFIPNRTPCGCTRREFLWQLGGGFAGVALLDLLASQALADGNAPLAAKAPHFPAKAKHCVFLFMNGGPSQVDTFDPKPDLAKFDGSPYKGDAKVGSNGRAIGHL